MTLLPFAQWVKDVSSMSIVLAVPVFINNIIHGLFTMRDSLVRRYPVPQRIGWCLHPVWAGIKWLAAV